MFRGGFSVQAPSHAAQNGGAAPRDSGEEGQALAEPDDEGVPQGERVQAFLVMGSSFKNLFGQEDGNPASRQSDCNGERIEKPAFDESV